MLRIGFTFIGTDPINSVQLQATAQVAKSYVLEQDTANVNTIINALQQGGGSGGKQEGIITLTTNDYGTTYTVDYNGDGQLSAVVECSHAALNFSDCQCTISGNRLNLNSSFNAIRYGYIFATETANFAPAWVQFEITNNEPI